MRFDDYSPTPNPSIATQHDSLRKGLGRAYLWSKAGRIDLECLLEACLHDLRFDVSVDGCRAGWLWEIMLAANMVDQLREPVWSVFANLADQDDADQLCSLARRFADAGDSRFRRRLYEVVEQRQFPEIPWLGEEPLIALEGDAGFLFAARIRGSQLANREWDWDDRHLVDVAIEGLGEQHVRDILAASEERDLQRLHETWLNHCVQSYGNPRASHAERMRSIPLAEILTAAESPSGQNNFRGWGMFASEADLGVVRERLFATNQPDVIEKYLKVFSNRAMPCFDARLLELGQHPHEGVRRWALNAAAENSHPAIREFALSRIRNGLSDSKIAGLFVRNFHLGDAQLLLDAVVIPEDENENHWLWMGLRKVMAGNPECDDLRLAIAAYALTPCASCRHGVVKLLDQRRAAPNWLVEECQHDCESDTHELNRIRTVETAFQ